MIRSVVGEGAIIDSAVVLEDCAVADRARVQAPPVADSGWHPTEPVGQWNEWEIQPTPPRTAAKRSVRPTNTVA